VSSDDKMVEAILRAVEILSATEPDDTELMCVTCEKCGTQFYGNGEQIGDGCKLCLAIFGDHDEKT
jgi:hypothetical protein